MLQVLIINLIRVGEKTSYLYDIDIPSNLNKIEIIKNDNFNSIYELRLFNKHGENEYEIYYYAFCKAMYDDNLSYNEHNYYDFEVDKIFDRLFMLCQIKKEFDVDNVEILKEINEH